MSSRDGSRDTNTLAIKQSGWGGTGAAYLGHLGEDEDSSTFVIEGFDLDFLLGWEHGEFHEIMVLFGINFA